MWKGRSKIGCPEREVAFVLWHSLCCVADGFKQSDTVPEQIGVLWVGKLVGDKGDFFPRTLELLLRAFSFLP